MITSPVPDIEIPDVALTPHVLQRAVELGDKPAFIDGPSGRVITYAGLAEAVKLVAGALQARGFEPTDVLALMAPNIPEYAVAFHGVAWAGGATTTINPTYTAEEVHHQLLDSGAKFLVTISMFYETAAKAAEGTSVTEIFTFDEAEGATSALELLAGPALEEHVAVDPAEHIVVLPYSSGTTGRSKGVMLTHTNLVANVVQTLATCDVIDETDTYVAFLPFFHIYGMQVLMNTGLNQGVTIVTMPRFDLQQFLELNQQHRCRWGWVVPPVVLALAQHPMVDDYDLSALERVFSGAAPLGAGLAARASERLGAEVIQGYGMTELSPVSHLTPAGHLDKPGSIGVAVANTQCRIVDPEGDDVPTGEPGELWVRGPQVMKGYFGNTEATTATLDDQGWLHTGDVATADEDGYFWIVDRVKELVKYKGFQVPPAELEALLVTHDDIADAAVIGVPDDEAGELPKAFVVRRPGSELTADEVMQFVAGRVAGYKRVHLVEFIDEIPKSASGKILRRELR